MKKLLKRIKRVAKQILGISPKEKKEKKEKREKKEKIDIFVETPNLTVKELCELSEINVSGKYIGEEKTLLNKDKVKKIIRLKEKSPEYVKKLKFSLMEFVKKYYTQDPLEGTEEQLIGHAIDWLYHFGSMGFTYNEYFDYELYNKTDEQADTFLNGKYRGKLLRLCNKKEDRILLKDKAKFNTTYSKYIKREWLDTTKCTFEEFEKFAQKYPVHFGKPVRGTGGYGAGVYDSNGKDLKSLFEEYKNGKLIIEDIVKQHEDLAKYNESSLNTLRVYSLLCADGKARVLLAIIRFGRQGNPVDNFHCGGVTAVVDVETGIVSTDSLNRTHTAFAEHPDSKLPIKGFKIPCWDKVVETITDAATIVPTLKHIGWDVAVTNKGEVELIEGNSWPNFDAPQAPDQIGKKYCYEKYVDELIQLKKQEKKNKK